ncbi:MAG: bifunctional diaminohydroxyphosphoribosylaminopyrimidine deaminase/5-amino-6-(5-phosphoribosylamino)uracil reductase RibD [Bacteroidales bacterium]|nr:bifunctional diaminohydroxyphosphoribosylaminopyrimidine deaminase/5-amino-6-(5-phosphoribosylamino)uracil reductase RibD [Bacteroidales bacterium]
MLKDTMYMHRCLQLAGMALGQTAPNPMVGAVVVWNDQVIGEGYHQRAGEPHAEVEAVLSVKDKSRLSESTLYVNLEPCNHYGKTPPCTDLILANNIPRLVVAQVDPNPLVAGQGLQRLRDHNVEVVEGVLEKEALELNRRFNTYHTLKRPYIILKWAKTRDGFIDTLRDEDQPANPAWITDEYCRTLVHKWRTEESAIIVGTRTAKMDNPQLNIRVWTGEAPIRLVIDRNNILPDNLHLFDQSQETWVFTEKDIASKHNIKYIKLNPESNNLDQIMNILYDREIQSLIVEGGSELLNSFIKQNLWDEARVFTGNTNFEQGVPAPKFPFTPIKQIATENSLLEMFRNKTQ